MSKKSLHVILPLIVYPFDIFVSVGQSDSAFKRSIPKDTDHKKNKDLCTLKAQGDYGGCVGISPKGHVCLRMIKWPKTALDFGNLQHEIFHTTAHVMGKIEMPLTKECEEAYAYLVGYITEQVYMAMDKKNKKK